MQKKSPLHRRLETSPLNRHEVCIDTYLNSQRNYSRSPKTFHQQVQSTKYFQLDLTNQKRRQVLKSKSPTRSKPAQPMIILNIDTGNGRCELLRIYQKSDAKNLALDFVKSNKLDQSLVPKIAYTIQQQMELAQNLNLQVQNTPKKKPLFLQKHNTKYLIQQKFGVDQVTVKEFKYYGQIQPQNIETPPHDKKKIFSSDKNQIPIKKNVFPIPKPLDSPQYRPPTFSPISRDVGQFSTSFQSPCDHLSKDLPLSNNNRANIVSDYITDKVLVKRLFQMLDADEDGLISTKTCKFQRMSSQLTNKIMPLLQNYGQHIQFEYDDFYRILTKDNSTYFDILKELSDFFNEKLVMVAVK